MIMLCIDRIWKWLKHLCNILALYGILLCTEYFIMCDQVIIVRVLLFMKTISRMLWQKYSQCKTCDVRILFLSLTPCCRRNFTLAFMKMLGACPGPFNHCQCIWIIDSQPGGTASNKDWSADVQDDHRNPQKRSKKDT